MTTLFKFVEKQRQKLYVCPICGAAFLGKRMYNRHRRLLKVTNK